MELCLFGMALTSDEHILMMVNTEILMKWYSCLMGSSFCDSIYEF